MHRSNHDNNITLCIGHLGMQSVRVADAGLIRSAATDLDFATLLRSALRRFAVSHRLRRCSDASDW